MLFLLFFLNVVNIELNENLIEYFGNKIKFPASILKEKQIFKEKIKSQIKTLLDDSQKRWIFIHLDANMKCDILKNDEIEFDDDSFITSNTCLAFITEEKAKAIREKYNAKLKPLKMKNKLHDYDESSNKFTGRFHKSFNYQNYNFEKSKFIKLSDEIYSIVSDDIEEVLSIPELRSISSQFKTSLQNRWNAGFIQKNQPPSDLMGERWLNNKGLTGKGEIVTVVDSGLDINNPYFYDPNQTVEFGKINYDHRKVVLYTCYGNDHDSFDSHGTHLAGVVAGSSLYHNASELYNGVAYNAKLNIVDITENDQDGTSVLSYSAINMGEDMGKVDSKIALGGWGSSNNIETSYYYDMLASTTIDGVLVFPAGNKGSSLNSILTPGDGKNILTVGAVSEQWSSQFEDPNIRKYILSGTSSSNPSLNSNTYEISMTHLSNDYYFSYNYGYKILNTKTSNEIKSDSVFLTSNINICEILQGKQQFPFAIIYINQSEPKCDGYDLKQSEFPVFWTTNTDIFEFSEVSVSIQIPGEYSGVPQVASYSSRGPSYIGIQKPDVVAPGTKIFSAGSSNVTEFVSASDGTSNAAAYVAGVASLVKEYFDRGFYPYGVENESCKMSISSNIIRGIIVASAEPLPGSSRTPNLSSGHGIVNISSVLTFDNRLKIIDNLFVENGKHYMCKLKFNPKDEIKSDLRIVLSYLDKASTSSYIALQSDADIYIKLSNGTIIYGNHRPENHEERFSTIEKITIYRDELINSLNNSSDIELHLVVGYGFSSSIFNGALSFVLHGDFSTNNTFEFTEIDFVQCELPTSGINCQYNVTEYSIGKTTVFKLYSNTVSLGYIPIPQSYTQIFFRVRRTPSTSGKITIQFKVDDVNLYPNNYPYYITLTNPDSVVALKRNMFGAHKIVGIRISNMAGTDYEISAGVSYEEGTIDPTPSISPKPTMQKDILFHVALSYTLFAAFLIPSIVLIVLSLRLFKKRDKDREERKRLRQIKRERRHNKTDITPQEETATDDIRSQLLPDTPL